MPHLHRLAAIGVLALLAWSAACANHDTECSEGYKSCGTPAVCCSGVCNNNNCEAPAGVSTSSSSSSGFPSSSSGGVQKDPQCAKEQIPSRTKFCTSVGKCIDPKSDSDNCGQCDNACTEDTNGIPLTCFDGECQ